MYQRVERDDKGDLADSIQDEKDKKCWKEIVFFSIDKIYLQHYNRFCNNYSILKGSIKLVEDNKEKLMQDSFTNNTRHVRH